MSARAAGLALAALGVAALAGCATAPPQPDPVQLKLNDLDARLTRIERVVQNRSLLQIANQIEAARADLRSVHDSVDQMRHEIDQNQRRDHDLYADLDARLTKLENRAAAGGAAPAAGTGVASGAGEAGTASGAAAGPPPSGAAATGDESPLPAAAADGGAAASGSAAGGAAAGRAGTAAGSASGGDDAQAYQAAFDLLKKNQYDEAIAAFKRFLADHPQSEYADNAQYWLGETYYVNRDFDRALAAFRAVVDVYGQSRKLPDSMLKIGYCEYELKHDAAAKRELRAVVAKFPDTTVARLASQRLQKMRAEGR